VTSVKRVTDIIGEIVAASQEQSTGIDQVNRAVGQMDQVTQSIATQTEELSSTAESLATQAHQLQELVGRFKLDYQRESSGPAVPFVPLKATPPRPAARRLESVLPGFRPNGAGHGNGAGDEEDF
jgi:methyl-accepting chemotaxis protein